MKAEPLLRARNVGLVYRRGDSRVVALANIDLDIQEHDRVALLGRSGSGKTTLLHVLGGLVEPTSGEVVWQGRDHTMLDAAARAAARAKGLAFVFQSANLLPYFTAYENVAFAARAASAHADVGPAGTALLELVGLGDKAANLPDELSGGEQQRVAIARALASQPRLLLCDEPTGHLDSDTGERVLDLIDALQREYGFAVVIATHDPSVAARLVREVELHDGRVTRQEVHA